VVRLRPHFRRRVLIIGSGMLAVIIGACGLGVLVSDRATLPQDPEAVAYAVVGALGKFAGDDLADARKVMTGDKIADMMGRLGVIHEQLLTIDTFYQLEQTQTTANQTGDRATVTTQVRLSVETPDHTADYVTTLHPWTFETVQHSLPDPGWFLTDFTAPDVCRVYLGCGAAVPTPTPSGPSYPPVYLSCAQVNAQGVEDTVGNYTVEVDANGAPDFTAVWQHINASCTTDVLHDEPVASSPIEKAAVAATAIGGKTTSIGVLYTDCAQRFTLNHVADNTGHLATRLGEYRGVLVLCPGHPDAKAIQEAINAG
jgi:hypothetical protein